MTRWVPTSEKLPEKEGCYLVTVVFAYEGVNRVVVNKLKFVNENWSKEYWNKFVKAWMSLPKPYEAEEV